MAVENWQQVGVVAVVVLALGFGLWVMRNRIKKIRVRPWSAVVETTEDTEPSEQVLHLRRSKVLKSLLNTIRGTKIGLVDSKIEKSTIVVRGENDPNPDPGTGPGGLPTGGSGQG
ncbi:MULTISPECIES: hypothetical protein [unclassified Streptomyces]|uniref:hypothetical protein n=1 Tax=unclassified Streptomyces TaxID=2593676 RepID=UPI001BEBAEAB|nr:MULTISPECIES: hypothetical protein [unclassified Streptomyces]MBT2404217.1 hypothetical protein [Streptomyces sp. ISL-21]MBT2458820.1 hypothetical protein [Streptomyces sp. ISL-86]MBT2612894.1 hypothetical protein [Streptomyces sp. ISL-87]